MQSRYWNRPRICQPRMLLEQLEERIVLDASVGFGGQQDPDAGHADTGFGMWSEDGGLSGSSAYFGSQATSGDDVSNVLDQDLKVVLISNALDEIEAISAAVVEEARVIVYDAENASLESIGNNLAELVDDTGRRIDHLALFTHGMPGVLDLSETQGLTYFDVKDNPDQWTNLAELLTQDARIDLYGCDVGQGGLGMMLVQAIANATGAAVRASDDATGTVGGADWDLEVKSGSSDSRPLFEPDKVADASISLSGRGEGLPAVTDNLDFENTDLSGWEFWPSNVQWELISVEDGFPATGYPFADSEHLIALQAPEDSSGSIVIYYFFESGDELLQIDHAWYSQDPASMYTYAFGDETSGHDAEYLVLAHMGSSYDDGTEGPSYYRSADTGGVVTEDSPEGSELATDWAITFDQGWISVSHDVPQNFEKGVVGIMVDLAPGATAYLDFRVQPFEADAVAPVQENFTLSPQPEDELPSPATDDGAAVDLRIMPLFTTTISGHDDPGIATLETNPRRPNRPRRGSPPSKQSDNHRTLLPPVRAPGITAAINSITAIPRSTNERHTRIVIRAFQTSCS